MSRVQDADARQLAAFLVGWARRGVEGRGWLWTKDCAHYGLRTWCSLLGSGYSVLWHLKLAQKVHAFSYNARPARATAAIVVAAAAAAAASWEIVNYLACRRRKTAVEAAPE